MRRRNDKQSQPELARARGALAALSPARMSHSALTHIAKANRVAVIISCFNGLIFVAGAWDAVSHALLLGWFAAVVGPGAYLFRRSQAVLKRPPPPRVSRRAFRRALLFVLAMAAPWVAAPLLFLPPDGGGLAHQITIVSSGMCAGGAFMLYRAPPLAVVYFGALLASVVVASMLHGFEHYWALTLFTLPYGAYLLVITLSTNNIAQESEENVERMRAALAELGEANHELDKLRAQAESEAVVDALTGLTNRRGLMLEMAHRGADAARLGGAAIFHLDLDRFKEINDTIGHAGGDFVLQHVARILRTQTRAGDCVARIGGDEFVLLVDFDGAVEPLRRLAERCVAELRKPVTIGGEAIYFGASVGVATARVASEGAAIDMERLLANADLALYKAKEAGRGRYEFFSTELRTRVESERRLGDELLGAIEAGQIAPVYQPQCCADGRTLAGVEALARWRHPTRGLLAPAAFLPIADRIGATALIDQAILRAALRDLARWDAQGLKALKLSVNLSLGRLNDPALREEIERLAPPAGRLVFEVLESVFSDDIDTDLREQLDWLEAAGIDIELDDFGTGHSSLVALLSLRPKRIKIARQLATPAASSPSHLGLIRSVVDIAKSLGIGVTAEGVETEEEARILVEVGCDRLQGYHFARPMAAEALLERFGPPEHSARRA